MGRTKLDKKLEHVQTMSDWKRIKSNNTSLRVAIYGIAGEVLTICDFGRGGRPAKKRVLGTLAWELFKDMVENKRAFEHSRDVKTGAIKGSTARHVLAAFKPAPPPVVKTCKIACDSELHDFLGASTDIENELGITLVQSLRAETSIKVHANSQRYPNRYDAFWRASLEPLYFNQLLQEGRLYPHHGDKGGDWQSYRFVDKQKSEGRREDDKNVDMVNNAPHYGGVDNPYEVVKVLEAWGLDAESYLWNTVKYIARCFHKGNTIQDLKKARYYLDRDISNRENKKGKHANG